MRSLLKPGRPSGAFGGARGRLATAALFILLIVGSLAAVPGADARGGSLLQQQLLGLTKAEDGPPGVIAVVQRGKSRRVYRAGVAVIGRTAAPDPRAAMRVASVSKAFSGAAAVRLAREGVLNLDMTIGEVLPDLPVAWHGVTLEQLLAHRSGLPDFSASPDFGPAIGMSPQSAPPPRALLEFVADEPLNFAPGSAYHYSNSDNIAVGLILEAITGEPYAAVLRAKVLRSFGLRSTLLPHGLLLPTPFLHGYGDEPPEDISQIIAFGGWAWASGGLVSTPLDLNRFIRHYVRIRRGPFGPGSSEPTGPGKNRAGLGIFRYDTRCGIVFGHTGSISGYTQFIAANGNGRSSVTFSISSQATPGLLPLLRRAQAKAVCMAMH